MARLLSIFLYSALWLELAFTPVFAAEKVYLIRHKAGQSFADVAGWEQIVFEKISKTTEYTPVKFKGRFAIRAHTNGGASGWLWRGDIDIEKTPYLNWCWAVANTYEAAQAGTRRGDDYPARIYANFAYDKSRVGLLTRLKYSTFKKMHGNYPPLSVVNYIWASHLPKGQSIESAYASNVMLLALQHQKPYQKWRCERRHLIKDHVRLFGQTPTPLTGIALMTDADNTDEQATAYYGDIWFSRR